MRCKNCGAESDCNYCLYCGARIDPIQINNANANITSVNNPSKPAKKKKKPLFKRWWFWLIIGILFVFLISSLGKQSDSPGEKSDSIQNVQQNTLSEEELLEELSLQPIRVIATNYSQRHNSFDFGLFYVMTRLCVILFKV